MRPDEAQRALEPEFGQRGLLGCFRFVLGGRHGERVTSGRARHGDAWRGLREHETIPTDAAVGAIRPVRRRDSGVVVMKAIFLTARHVQRLQFIKPDTY